MGSLRYVNKVADQSRFDWLRARKPDLGRVRSLLPDFSSVRSRLRLPALGPWQLGVLLGTGAVLLLFVLFVSVDGGLYYNQIHHGIRVAGEDLGGLSRDDATAALTAVVQESRKQPIILTGGDESWEVLPGDVGTIVDVAASVAAAEGLTRDGNAFVDLGRRIKLYFSGRDLPLQGTVDGTKLGELVDDLAVELDRQPRNARMVIRGDQITIAQEVPGVAVDKDALTAQLKTLLFTLDGSALQIPMITTTPDIGVADISPALKDASMMISTDVALTYGEQSWTLSPRDIASFMDLNYRTADGVRTLVASLSAAKMGIFLDGVAEAVDTPPVDATMDSDGQNVWVVAAVDGQTLDREGTVAALADAARWVSRRTVEVVLAAVEPDLTTGEVKAMGITDLLASYATTPYWGSKNRQNNVRLGTSLCSGILLAPGEEFDTDERLGKRDRAHGWRTAPGIVGRGQLEDVYGGGICQVSTTLFNAVFEAGLEVLERHNHSMYISHYPSGRDATVTSGGKNMRFRNDTDHYVLIWGKSTGIVTEFFIWGVSDGRTVTSSFSGFRSRRCTVTRTVSWPDGTVRTDKFASRYIY